MGGWEPLRPLFAPPSHTKERKFLLAATVHQTNKEPERSVRRCVHGLLPT